MKDTELYMNVELNYDGDWIHTFYYRLHVNEKNEVIDGFVYRIAEIGRYAEYGDEDDTLLCDDFEEIHLFSNIYYSPDSMAAHVQFIFEQYKEEITEFLKGTD